MTNRNFLILVFTLLTCGSHSWAFSQFAPAVMIEAEELQPDENPLKTIFEEVAVRERAFLSRVCQLSAEQKTQADAVSTELKAEAIKKAGAGVEANNRFPQAQVMIRMGNNHVQIEKTAMSKFRKSLHDKYKTLLTNEQSQAFQDELKARDEFIRRANAECLVTILDLRLSLEPEQVEPLRQALIGWEEAEDLQLSYYLQENGQGYMPPIPFKFYGKLLNPAQRKIFDAAQKVSVNRHMVMDMNW